MTNTEIKEKLASFFDSKLDLRLGDNFDETTPLSNLLDSLGILVLTTHISKHFKVKVKVSDLSNGALNTFSSTVDFISGSTKK